MMSPQCPISPIEETSVIVCRSRVCGSMCCGRYHGPMAGGRGSDHPRSFAGSSGLEHIWPPPPIPVPWRRTWWWASFRVLVATAMLLFAVISISGPVNDIRGPLFIVWAVAICGDVGRTRRRNRLDATVTLVAERRPVVPPPKGESLDEVAGVPRRSAE